MTQTKWPPTNPARFTCAFEKPSDWFQGGWGRDDDGIALNFTRGRHILDPHDDPRPPALGIPQP